MTILTFGTGLVKGAAAISAALLWCAVAEAAVTFETQHLRFTLNDNGSMASLIDRASKTELLGVGGARPFMSVTLRGAYVPATALSLAGDRLRVTFGAGAAEAGFSVKRHPSHLAFELLSLRSEEGITEVSLANLLVKPLARAAAGLNAAYDDQVMVGIMALNLPVRCDLVRRSAARGTKPGVTQSLKPSEASPPVGNRCGEYTATSTLPAADGWAERGKSYPAPLDLSGFAGLGLWVRGDGKGELLKVQLHDGLGSQAAVNYKDHYIAINFTGWRYVELPRDPKDGLNYAHVASVNLYYNNLPANTTVTCGLDDLRALKTLTGKPSTSPDDLLLEDFESLACDYYDQEGIVLRATCLKRYGLVGSRFAVWGCPRAAFGTVMPAIEKAEGLPCPQLSGRWGRESPDIKRSYIMLGDLSEANVDRAIEYAKLANLAMIVLCEPSWAVSEGHFELNETRFPHGLEGLKQTVARINAAGLRAGLHFLADGIGRYPPDRYLSPVPDPRLLKDAETTLSQAVDAQATVLPTAEEPAKFPKEDGGYMGEGTDLQVDQEVITYGAVGPTGFSACTRGAYGTTAAPHAPGAKVSHLRRQYGMLMRDIDGTINDEVADRIATIVNACGFGMVYFDGSEWLQGDHWYYNAKLHQEFRRRFRNPDAMLIQGSSWSHLSWHMHSRYASADGYADIKKLLDERSPAFEEWYRGNFMPLDVGWYGLGQDRLRMDDIEYVCCRSIGFDASIGWSTNVADLDANPRSREMLELAGRYEQLRLATYFDERQRARLREPAKDYRLLRAGDRWQFASVEYDPPVTVAALDGKQNVWRVANAGKNPRQPVEIELTCGPVLQPGANWDRADNVTLEDFRSLAPYGASPGNQYEQYVIGPGKHGAVKAGVTQRFELSSEVTRTGAPTARYEAISTLADDSGWSAMGKRFDAPLDLSWMQGLGLWVHGDGNGALLKVQLRDAEGGWNDHYMKMDYTGWRYHELVKPQSGELDRAHVEYLIFYFNALPGNKTSTVHLDTLKALRELSPPVGSVAITLGGRETKLPVRLEAGQTLLFRSLNECLLYTRGQKPSPIKPTGAEPVLAPGENEIRVTVDGALTRGLTVRTAKVYR